MVGQVFRHHARRDPLAHHPQATFVATNIEYDNVSEASVDNTKELQIEEALKLYQDALRLHAEGPASYDETAKAYAALFDSEIFKWSESLTDYRRSEIDGDLGDEEEAALGLPLPLGPQQLASNTDVAPNTLPQILHLAYKNHGLFLLQVLQHKVRHGSSDVDIQGQPDTVPTAHESLDYFAQALDKDDADTDLWRSSATVAAIAGSTRVSRFCLEAILDGDDEGLEGILSLPSIDESYATQKLQQLTGHLSDDLVTRSLRKSKTRQLAPRLVERIEPFSGIPRPTFDQSTYSRPSNAGCQPQRRTIQVSRRDWAAVGEVIISQLVLTDSTQAAAGPGAAVLLELPPLTADISPPTEIVIRTSPKSALSEVPPSVVSEGRTSVAPDAVTEVTNDMDMVQDAVVEIGAIEAPLNVVPRADGEEAGQHLEPGDASTTADDTGQARKRSIEDAELPEQPDGGRLRSKRNKRTRDTLEGQTAETIDPVAQYQQAMQQYSEADEWLFETIQQIFDPVGAQGIGTSESLRKIATPDTIESTIDQEPLHAAIQDLFDISQNCSMERARVFASSDSLDMLASHPIEYGLQSIKARQTEASANRKPNPTVPLQGLSSWVEAVNSAWSFQNDIAWDWLLVFLMPGHAPGTSRDDTSSYTMHTWSDELKRNIVQVMVHNDEYITARIQDHLGTIEQSMLHAQAEGQAKENHLSRVDSALIEVSQTIFELHLDVYKKFKHPSSGIDLTTLNSQRYRLERWSTIAHTAINLRSTRNRDFKGDQLAIRHVWAIAFQISSLDDVPQHHVSAVMRDLRELLVSLDDPPLFLQNNAVMPEVSVAAIDQELNDINMQKFFQKVFNYNQDDPIAVMDSLEPILEVQIEESRRVHEKVGIDGQTGGPVDAELASATEIAARAVVFDEAASPILEVSRFLSKGSVTLRLSLWQRLRQAFQAINYMPKVVYCHLQSINMLMAELMNPAYREQDKVSRALPLLHYLALIDELLKHTIDAQKTCPGAFEFIDADLLQQTLSSLQSLARLLTTFNIYEDCVRVGQLPPPIQDGRPKPAFVMIGNKMYGLEVRNWVLQYALLVEAIDQKPEAFASPKLDRLNFIRAVHHNVGLRGICNRAEKALLKLARDELLQLSDLDGFEGELSQVLFDLYGLKCINPALLHDHRCPEAESITRTRALQLIGFIMAQANKIQAKDLHKSDLKLAIDKVHGFLHMLRQKSSEEIMTNRRIFKAYIASPINPIDVLSGFRGTFELPLRRISPAQAPVASTGWYALMANVALGKFKISRRNAPGSTEELSIAIEFFKQDLEYSANKWETWYNLAQCYDLQLEECVSWTAEKLNSQYLAQPKENFPEIVQYQRSAIHCYAVAVSTILRSEDEIRNTKKVAEVYYDFALRLYASAREPFSMQVFAFRETEERFFSRNSLFKRTPFAPTKVLQAYRMVIVMISRSIALAPENWPAHYLLGKVLWKAYQIDKSSKAPKPYEITQAAIRAIDAVPEKDKAGGKGRDPILEPHYKLVTLTNKLVSRDAISLSDGLKALRCSFYGRKVDSETKDRAQWSRVVLGVISELKSADKANWQHRISARAARILQKDRMDPEHPNAGTQAAKEELTQNMFTKTMQIQVWRPDNERPGRHFVYTTRYLRYFTALLIKLEDRQNLELLIRRLRRKPHEFLNHAKLWETVVLDYLRLLRKVASVPSGHEETVFKSMNHEDFTIKSGSLETWAHSATAESVVLDVVKEATELKRMNMGLMKHTLIDDLICDAYARLFEVIVPTLTPPPQTKAPEDQDGAIKSSASAPGPHQTSLAGSSAIGMIKQSTVGISKPSARIKTVGRREILRKAETCINRPVAAAIAAIAPKTPNSSTVHPRVVIASRPSTEATATNDFDKPAGDRRDNSVPLPLKPSANLAMSDTDSELSEVDESMVEEIERKGSFVPLFPALKARLEKIATEDSEARDSPMGTDVEADGGDDEGDEEEGEGQEEQEGHEEDDGDEEDIEMEDEGDDAGDEEQGDADDEDEDDGTGQADADQTATGSGARLTTDEHDDRPSTSGFVTITPRARRTAPVDDSQDPVGTELTSDVVSKGDEDMEGNSDY